MRRPDQARGKGAPHGGGSLGEGLEKAEVPKVGGWMGGPLLRRTSLAIKGVTLN